EVGTLLPRIEAQDLDDADGYVKELLDNTVLGLEETAAGLDMAALDRAAAALSSASRVDVYAAGSSYLVGSDLVEKLKRIGIYASSYANDYLQSISSAGLREGDVAVAVSYSGETRSVAESLAIAAEQG